jgi:hypothetical protein
MKARNCRDVVEEIEMIAEPKHEIRRDDTVRGKRERKRHEKALDEALRNTFPASDPVSVEQPMVPAVHTIDADSH